MKKDPLGRGLSAILNDIEEKGSSKLIPIDQIVPNRTQPRLKMDEKTISELAASIREKGLLQPIILKRKNKGYEIIAGERRFRAAVLAGLKEVPAIVKNVDDREALEIALVENLQREDLNPVEIAIVYERFVEEFSFTHEEVAQKMGVDRSSVSNVLRLLKLPPWIKELITDGKLTQGHARALLSLKNEKEQKRFVDRVLKDGVSVRELERQTRKKASLKNPAFALVEEDLQKALQTKVDITFKRNKGKIIIEFYSKEDLERIAERIAES
ncbi:MAG TPA: ParB/RepB/Spo0J family partition protein [Syntrophorhabdaceae bacterium]|nr:ParB/RepB/Spo0J family partition protein [Syntrophorhabdaceae bacterium]